MKIDKQLIGYWFLTLSIFFDVLIYVINDYTLASIPPYRYALSFFLLPVLFVTPFYIWHYGIRTIVSTFKNQYRAIIGAIFFSVIAALLWFYILAEIGSTSVSLLEKSTIVFSALLGIALLKEKLNRWEMIGVVFAFLGALILGIENVSTQLIPILLAILFALDWSLFSYFLKKECQGISPTLLNLYRVWGMLLAMILVTFFTGEMKLLSLNMSLLAFISGMGAIMGSVLLFIQSHKYLPISTLNAYRSLAPVAIAFALYVIFGQIPSLHQVVGGSVILIGVLLIVFFRKKLPISPDELPAITP